jgi:transcriptional regulator with GAF, ATPase, and Fis domain
MIHDLSPRRSQPYIAVNCAALPESLVESELFGHEKGSFTGATHRRAGLFELARGGTLFLDEVGELPKAMQAKLLRVLEDGAFQRVGGADTLHADVRLIAAINRHLESEIDHERFRADLFYRLSAFPVNLPSLAERRGDIPLLVNYFVRRHAQRMCRSRWSRPRRWRCSRLTAGRATSASFGT